MSVGDKPINPIPDPATFHAYGLTYREWLIGQIAAGYKFEFDKSHSPLPRLTQMIEWAGVVLDLAHCLIERMDGEEKP